MLNQRGFTHILIFFVVSILISGVIGFNLGKKTISSPIKSSENTVKNVDQCTKLTKFENLASFSPKGSLKSFDCFREDKLPDDAKVNKIKEELKGTERLIENICSESEGKYYIVNTYLLNDDLRKVNQRIDLDTFVEPDFFTSEFIYQPENKNSEIKDFKLIKWFSSGDLIFTLAQFQDYIMTYYKSADFKSPLEMDAKLVEYCSYGIAGGTSARYINFCTSFTRSKESLYLQKSDLP